MLAKGKHEENPKAYLDISNSICCSSKALVLLSTLFPTAIKKTQYSHISTKIIIFICKDYPKLHTRMSKLSRSFHHKKLTSEEHNESRDVTYFTSTNQVTSIVLLTKCCEYVFCQTFMTEWEHIAILSCTVPNSHDFTPAAPNFFYAPHP